VALNSGPVSQCLGVSVIMFVRAFWINRKIIRIILSNMNLWTCKESYALIVVVKSVCWFKFKFKTFGRNNCENMLYVTAIDSLLKSTVNLFLFP
jgi:hypothetical protein